MSDQPATAAAQVDDPLDWPLWSDYDGATYCDRCSSYIGCALKSTRELLERVTAHVATCTRQMPEPEKSPTLLDPPAKLNSEGTVMGSYTGGPVDEHEHRYYLAFPTCIVPGCTARRSPGDGGTL